MNSGRTHKTCCTLFSIYIGKGKQTLNLLRTIKFHRVTIGQNSVNLALYNYYENVKHDNYYIDQQNLLIYFQNDISYTLIHQYPKMHCNPNKKSHKNSILNNLIFQPQFLNKYVFIKIQLIPHCLLLPRE